MAGVSVVEARSIAEIGEDAWQRLARRDGFYLGYAWLAWAECDPSYVTTYLVARDAGTGVPVAAAVTYLWDGAAVPSMNLAYSPGHIAEENAGRALSPEEHRAFLPALLVGSRAGYHGGVVVAGELPGDRREAVLRQLFVAVEALAARLGAGCVAMLYVPMDHAVECRAAWERALDGPGSGPSLAPLSAEAVLDLAAGQRAAPAARGEWRRERRRYEDAVERVETARLSQCVDAIAPLLGATQRKYGSPDSDDDMLRYFAGQVPALDAYSHVLLEYLGREVVGFSLSYLWHDGVYVRAGGFDKRAARYSYFNLGMYGPRELAVDRGLPVVHLGAGSYGGKRARGAEPRFTGGLVRPPARIPADVAGALRRPGADYRQAVQVWGRGTEG
jgi:uncharacterized protein